MAKAILFDVYGTLISTGTGSVDAVRAILKRTGAYIEPTEFYREWKALNKQRQAAEPFMTEADIFAEGLHRLYQKRAIRSNAADDVKIMLASLYNRKAYPEVRQALRELGKTHQIIIASNTDTAPFLQNAEANGLRFEHVFTSESLRRYKPSALFYGEILRKMGLRGEDAVFIGDSLIEDIRAPQGFGMKTVLIDRLNAYRANEIVPDAIANAVPSVLPF